MLNDPRSLRDVRERDEGRNRPRGRGSFINYYEDIGASTTEEGHKVWKAKDEEFQGQIGKAKQGISEAQGKYDEALREHNSATSGLPGLDSALDAAWRKTESSFVPIRVVDGNKVEATYMLPREVADNFPTEAYHANWVDGGKYFNIDVDAKGGGGKRGAELHDSLANAYANMKTDFYEQAAPKLQQQLGSAQGQFNTAMAANQGALDSYAAEIQANKEFISGTEAEAERQKQKIRDQYQKRLATLKEIFGGFKIDKAKPEQP
jgi:hypothetical protein